MAAPMFVENCALALRFKPCSHNHTGKNLMTSIPINQFVIDVFYKYHEGRKSSNAVIKCSTEIGATPRSGSIFEVEGIVLQGKRMFSCSNK